MTAGKKQQGEMYLLKDVAEKADVDLRDAKALVRSMVRVLEKMPAGAKLRITSLGVFTKVVVPEHNAKNPKTSEAIVVPERERIRFHCSPGLRDTK